jgi:hypothetical protein
VLLDTLRLRLALGRRALSEGSIVHPALHLCNLFFLLLSCDVPRLFCVEGSFAGSDLFVSTIEIVSALFIFRLEG